MNRSHSTTVEVSSIPAHEALMPARPPFSLLHTVSALRRLPENLVDVLDDGVYQRAFETEDGIVVCRVHEVGRADAVRLCVHGAARDPAVWTERIASVLGLRVDLRGFYRAARADRQLHELAARFRGLKPPRYPDLWEAFVNAVPFQQVSLASGLAAVRKIVSRLGVRVRCANTTSFAFPPAARAAALAPNAWRAFGMSGAKNNALRALAPTVEDGRVSATTLESLPSESAARVLCELPGIGPWSAALILLRGMRRLDVFPQGDTGVARSLRARFGVAPGREMARARSLLAKLGRWRGMLYYHLLLSRLDAPR